MHLLLCERLRGLLRVLLLARRRGCFVRRPREQGMQNARGVGVVYIQSLGQYQPVHGHSFILIALPVLLALPLFLLRLVRLVRLLRFPRLPLPPPKLLHHFPFLFLFKHRRGRGAFDFPHARHRRGYRHGVGVEPTGAGNNSAPRARAGVSEGVIKRSGHGVRIQVNRVFVRGVVPVPRVVVPFLEFTQHRERGIHGCGVGRSARHAFLRRALRNARAFFHARPFLRSRRAVFG